MPVTTRGSIFFCGHELSIEELELIRQLVSDFPALSLSQLAETVCELLDWRRPSGSLKTRECFSFLQQLRERGWVGQLPTLQVTCPRGPRSISLVQPPPLASTVTGLLADYLPLQLQLIQARADRRLFQQYLERHHYLSYRVPYGAQLRYFVFSRQGELLACLLYTSAAWRMAPRDAWIGWDDSTRSANLSLVVNNSRFLILPWVRLPNLASHILSLSASQLPQDWQARYALSPLLLETLVETTRFSGTCYRAANWIEVGSTKGRGRMDRFARSEGSIKLIFLYPLTKNARRRLARPPNGNQHGDQDGDQRQPSSVL
jgi:hypothetical protein